MQAVEGTTLWAQARAMERPSWRERLAPLRRYEVSVLLAIAAGACVWFGALISRTG